MKQGYVKGTTIRIIGTLESIPGCAAIAGFDDEDEPVYGTTGTEVWWDGAMTERDDTQDRPMLVDENNDTRRYDEVEFRDENDVPSEYAAADWSDC